MKRCSYCGQEITGNATPVADDAATGAHAPAYWHAVPAECGPRAARPSGMDESSRLRYHLGRAGRSR
ncbi:hypothetical protein [Streptomyces cinereoruber]|uniref:hypothetical protein n=1 Tax=Streptomyces cinereoruber TaxID=67260 RepID=UPI0036308A0D